MNKFKQKYIIFIAVLVFVFLGIFYFRLNNSPSSSSATKNSESLGKNAAGTDAQDNSFIETLRNKTFKTSKVTIEQTLSDNSAYTSYEISYMSDNLKIYGVMNVPTGNGPFPVIIMNHGYFNQSTFKSGDGTQSMAEILAQNGYITLASDYRGFGKSQDSPQTFRGGHRPDYAIDVLNLIASVKNVKGADSSRIGMWGHSMGGEVSLRTAEATKALKAIVLWAPTSANAQDNANFYGRGRHGQSPSPASAPSVQGASPINYLQYINAPIGLHQGLSDTEVNPQWSRNLNEALKKAGKSVEYFEYPGQDHNFRNLGWDVIAPRTVAFFDKYVKGGEK